MKTHGSCGGRRSNAADDPRHGTHESGRRSNGRRTARAKRTADGGATRRTHGGRRAHERHARRTVKTRTTGTHGGRRRRARNGERRRTTHASNLQSPPSPNMSHHSTHYPRDTVHHSIILCALLENTVPIDNPALHQHITAT
ncbi:uncharacterized protein G2W53_018669 [Senna tora]|uniref:Uncharacterized protein n=1 Tax=Senna tora TaxID=362788 RepID=A0A834TS99_9FABA|nr:uncharacterized protein G2W53_018669 [Senna tora]